MISTTFGALVGAGRHKSATQRPVADPVEMRHYVLVRTRHSSFRNRVLAFADSGARTADGHFPPGTDGWASPTWSTTDDQVMLHPTSMFGQGLRRRRLEKLSSEQIDETIPRLTDVLDDGTGPAHLLLTVDGAEAMERVASTLRSADPNTAPNVWIASADMELLSLYRTRTSACLVDWGTTVSPDGGLERRAATLHGDGIDAVALPHKEWSAGSIALCHRFGLLAYGWGCEYEREMASLVDNGIDAIQTSFPDRLVAVLQQYQ